MKILKKYFWDKFRNYLGGERGVSPEIAEGNQSLFRQTIWMSQRL
jgi:hypothetical protein